MLLRLIFLAILVRLSIQDNGKHKPSQGIFLVELGNDNTKRFSKTVYNNTDIFIVDSPHKSKSNNDKCTYNGTVRLTVLIFGIHCKGLFSSSEMPVSYCIDNPKLCLNGKAGVYWKTTVLLSCDKETVFHFIGKPNVVAEGVDVIPTSATTVKPTAPKAQSKRDVRSSAQKATDSDDKTNDDDDKNKPSSNKKHNSTAIGLPPKTKNRVARVPFAGEYMVVLSLEKVSGEVLFDLEIRMKSPLGYLSADEYPLKTFYLIMCIVYVLYAVAWLIMSACNYHDLLRVQFWIGGVILLGLIEKSVHYSEYLNVNLSGRSEMGTEKFAAVVACVKRTVARMLVIIVSLGFGIVKPRLGPTLHRVIGVGVLYFIIALLEQMMFIDVYFNEGSREAWILMYIPLALIDSIICYWIFTSLLQTMKTLRLRRNTTKLSLYRHFANTIVFCVIISILMMLWAIHYHEQGCNVNFANAWFETACWPMLFSVILLVIMILWRPNANNQRYAYSPMIDGNGSDDDEEEEELMLGSGATETMKMRGSKKIVRSDVDKTEEDLKWIEENIPQTVADAAVPVLLDSDEEQMSTKYEMSKME